MTYPACERENGTKTGSNTKAAASFCANVLITDAVILTASFLLWCFVPVFRFVPGVAVLLLLIAVVITAGEKNVSTDLSFS